MMNVVLVTGVAGFIGRYVARYFKEQGWAVVGLDFVQPENAPLGNLLNYYRMNLPDSELKRVLIQQMPQLCVHCAGRASVGLSMDDPISDFYASPLLTLEILNMLRLHATECRFIFLSSAAVYGTPKSLPISEHHTLAPLSPYGFHKWQCEILCREFHQIYSMHTASVRIFSAYGPGLRRQVIWDICRKIIVQKTLNLIGTGRESRDFIHALDIARAIYIIAKIAPLQSEVYNLGSGQEVTIIELAEIILSVLESNLSPKFDGVVPAGTPLNWRADISRLEALGFTLSIPLEQRIKTVVNWCRAEMTGA